MKGYKVCLYWLFGFTGSVLITLYGILLIGVIFIEKDAGAALIGGTLIFGIPGVLCFILSKRIKKVPQTSHNLETEWERREVNEKENFNGNSLWDEKERENAKKISGVPQLVCPRCKKVYMIGKDACIVSLSNAFSFMAGQGTAIVGDANQIMNTTPDLVGYFMPNWDKEELENKMKDTSMNIERIRNMLQSGQQPYWECYDCRFETHPNPYPKDWSDKF